MNTIVWVVEILLAIVFLGSAITHAVMYDSASKQMTWMPAVGKDRLRIIGTLEFLGAVGLVAPVVTNILPWLSAVAAVGLALIMLFAVIFHLSRRGELPNAAFNAILGLIAIGVAIGRVAVG
jgi:hypothetical protein